TLVDEDDDGLYPALPQLWHQRVHGLGLVAKLEPSDARRRYDFGRVLQGKTDECHGHPFEHLDLISGKERLAGAPVDRAGCEIAELGACEWVRPLAAGRRMAAAILHTQQLILSLVELVVANRGDLKPHGRKGFDGRFVVEQRR